METVWCWPTPSKHGPAWSVVDKPGTLYWVSLSWQITIWNSFLVKGGSRCPRSLLRAEIHPGLRTHAGLVCAARVSKSFYVLLCLEDTVSLESSTSGSYSLPDNLPMDPWALSAGNGLMETSPLGLGTPKSRERDLWWVTWIFYRPVAIKRVQEFFKVLGHVTYKLVLVTEDGGPIQSWLLLAFR